MRHTIEELRSVFRYEPDTGNMFWLISPQNRLAPGSQAGTRKSCGYLYVAYKRKSYSFHRLAWALTHGEWPLVVDHADGDPTNNRLANLRNTNWANNVRNRKVNKTSRSGVKGVRKRTDSSSFTAAIRDGNKLRHLGTFKTVEEAHAAYKAAAIRLHGEFACYDR